MVCCFHVGFGNRFNQSIFGTARKNFKMTAFSCLHLNLTHQTFCLYVSVRTLKRLFKSIAKIFDAETP